MTATRPDRHPARYTRADAIADGLLIEVPTRLTRQYGLPWPLAVTAVAWFDAVHWDTAAEAGKPHPTGQTETARIAELLWAVTRTAANTGTAARCDVPFTVFRVPPIGPDPQLLPLPLILAIHDGDHGETVATISHPFTTANSTLR